MSKWNHDGDFRLDLDSNSVTCEHLCFKARNKEALEVARTNLSPGIRMARGKYAPGTQNHFQNNSICNMWQSLQALTGDVICKFTDDP